MTTMSETRAMRMGESGRVEILNPSPVKTSQLEQELGRMLQMLVHARQRIGTVSKKLGATRHALLGPRPANPEEKGLVANDLNGRPLIDEISRNLEWLNRNVSELEEAVESL